MTMSGGSPTVSWSSPSGSQLPDAAERDGIVPMCLLLETALREVLVRSRLRPRRSLAACDGAVQANRFLNRAMRLQPQRIPKDQAAHPQCTRGAPACRATVDRSYIDRARCGSSVFRCIDKCALAACVVNLRRVH